MDTLTAEQLFWAPYVVSALAAFAALCVSDKPFTFRSVFGNVLGLGLLGGCVAPVLACIPLPQQIETLISPSKKLLAASVGIGGGYLSAKELKRWLLKTPPEGASDG